MIRAGVPQTVAMSITGHKTVSMFNRYNITNQEDRREAVRRTAEHVAAAPRTNNVIPLNKERVGNTQDRKRTGRK
jgi:acyl-CoA thioesterase FadM